MDRLFREKLLTALDESYSFNDIEKLTKTNPTPLLLIERDKVVQRYKELREIMPKVTPHFAIKSCPIPEVLEIYKSISANLDVATNGEIKMLERIQYPPELLIHTHPHKRPEDMKRAYDYGIRTFVLDDLSEIEILEPYKNDIKLLLRLSFPNDHAEIDLSYKFGINPDEALKAVTLLLEKGFNLAGVSFHVGSQVDSPMPFQHALQKTLLFMENVKKELNHSFAILDIGGGFPAPYTKEVVKINDFAVLINAFVDKHCPDIQVISEPGRYLINPCITLLTKVVSKTTRNNKEWLFVDDGVYGTFADIISGHASYALFGASELKGATADSNYVVAGPTCDSIDVISNNENLPALDRGDVIIAPNIGAYSYALVTEFNSIPRAKVVVL